MAIEETRKKIHFVPFDINKGRDVDTSDAPTIKLTEGLLRFTKGLITELGLNGKFVRFFYDPIKKVVGFQVREEVELRALKGEGKWKMVRQNETNGSWTVSIRKMLAANFGSKVAEKKYPLAPIKKYIEMTDIMTKGQVYYFFEIVDEYDPNEVTEDDLEKLLR